MKIPVAPPNTPVMKYRSLRPKIIDQKIKQKNHVIYYNPPQQNNNTQELKILHQQLETFKLLKSSPNFHYSTEHTHHHQSSEPPAKTP